MSKLKKPIVKKIILEALSNMPYAAPIAGPIIHVWDSVETDKRFQKIEQKLTEISEAIGQNLQVPLESFVLKFLRIIDDSKLIPNLQLRKVESCMVFLKEINTKSKLGQENDPTIKYDECIGIAKNINPADPEKELGLIVYELEREDLIYKHGNMTSPSGYRSIGPKEYFFCRTDSIFQNWNPKDDAREVVKFLIDSNQNSIAIGRLDEEIKWGARRLNSAIAFLYLKELIHHDRDLGGMKYVLPWIRLAEEADFFL